MRVQKVCNYCKINFMILPCEDRKGKGKYCSRKCFKLIHPLIKTERTCRVCEQKFIVTKAMETKGLRKYCSRGCMAKGYSMGYNSHIQKGEKIELSCKRCLKNFLIKKYEAKRGHGIFCSRSCRNIFYSKPLSEEHKQKLRQSARERNITSQLRKIYSDAGRKGALKMLATKRNMTSIERKIQDHLLGLGIVFQAQYLINSKFLVDFYIPEKKLIIEADGVYWHSLDKTIKKDKAENAYLKKCGYNLLRLNEIEINNGTFQEKMRGFI